MSARPATRISSTRPTGRRRASATGTSRCAAPSASGTAAAATRQEVVDRFDEALDHGTESCSRISPSSTGPTWKTRSSASSPPCARTTSCPRTSSRRLRPGVALDDAVGDQLEQLAPLGLERPGVKRALGRSDPPARAGADLVEDAGGGDPVADRLRAPPASSAAGRARPATASRSRARISGSVTVPSSRSVPRALPVRSGGPVTSRTSSRSWKASPISRPKVSQRRRSARGRVPGRPIRQAHSNSRAVFSSQRSQVALGRDRAVECVAALGELAEREGDRGRGQQLHLPLGCRRCRARRRRARTAGRRPPAPASRPERATTVGRPRRSGAASSTSSWTSVAMWTSSIAVAARIAASPPPARR